MSDNLVSSVEKQGVLNRIGYGNAENIPSRIDSLVEGYIDNYHDFIAPSFFRVYKDVGEVSGNYVRIGTVTFKSNVLARLLTVRTHRRIRYNNRRLPRRTGSLPSH